ncbi:MAG: helix-turn-helix transcriptional regulator [Gammaproteobacteria bacterium]|nr:helix-turn-helix transcriptional regulator [Gammaproteobacteria bacterium]
MSNYRFQIEQHADMFKALGNPHRLAMFRRLVTCCTPGTVCDPNSTFRYTVSQLGHGLEIAPSTLSHHLKELNRAGLIEMRRNGKIVECWIEPAMLETLRSLFEITPNNQT